MLHYRLAQASDAPAIVALVNSAYRPAADTPAWTHESNWVTGARTTQPQVLNSLARIMLALQQDEVVGCIQIDVEAGVAHLGLFAVDPKRQAQGIGKQLLAHAEHYAHQQLHCQSFELVVLSVRHELRDFYWRRGYQLTGEQLNYDDIPEASVPKLAGLTVEVLRKTIVSAEDTPRGG